MDIEQLRPVREVLIDASSPTPGAPSTGCLSAGSLADRVSGSAA